MYRADFPILQEQSKLIYLDNAASTQKPKCVLNAMDSFYSFYYANVHKGNCAIATEATKRFEEARKKIADFLHTTPNNIVWTRGATNALNMVACGLAQSLTTGDEVLVSVAEHHANFVPWQQACVKKKATFNVFNVLWNGQLDFEDFQKKLTKKTKVVSLTLMSNVLGVPNDLKPFIDAAHQVGATVVVDGAQSIAHLPVNVEELDCDFLVFSGHKLYGPTGIGVLYGKTAALDALPPYEFGGDMVDTVTLNKTTFAPVPMKFEAGTPSFVEAIGLATAVDYLQQVGQESIVTEEKKLTEYAVEQLRSACPDIHFLGEPELKSGILSFLIPDIHPQDIAFVLAKENICVRVGHHCALPVHTFFDVSSSLRISLGLYNTKTDIDIFIQALQKALKLLKEA